MNWILTYTGRQFYPMAPRQEDLCVEDIAHALSNICRFNGHVREFYSVAQHCVLVSYAVNLEHALAALLHDASEAYLCDVPRPVKCSDVMQEYRLAEARLEALINSRFGINIHAPEVRAADELLLMAERRDLMSEHQLWPSVDCMITHINGWNPNLAEYYFIARFEELSKRMNIKKLELL